MTNFHTQVVCMRVSFDYAKVILEERSIQRECLLQKYLKISSRLKLEIGNRMMAFAVLLKINCLF